MAAPVHRWIAVLSPLLWSLVVEDLLELVTRNGIRCQGYADDIVILARGKFVDTLCDIVQRGLGLAKGWCSGVGLNINPTKTTSIPFTSRNLSLDGRVLEIANTVKYMGLGLDSTLRGKQHAELTLNKVTKAPSGVHHDRKTDYHVWSGVLGF